tara:strand:- start:268 stop:444 length:177 start_codon:yes stop_codon:yes gene_type:complete
MKHEGTSDIETPCMSCEKPTLWIVGGTVTSDNGKLVVYCMDCRERAKDNAKNFIKGVQ